jgi:hypothetical protein
MLRLLSYQFLLERFLKRNIPFCITYYFCELFIVHHWLVTFFIKLSVELSRVFCFGNYFN